MKKFLLDTNVVSELRRGAKCHPRVSPWQQAHGQEKRGGFFRRGHLRRQSVAVGFG